MRAHDFRGQPPATTTPKALRQLSVLISVALLAGSSAGLAHEDEEEIPFAEAHIFFELNNTDGDLGIHALIDGEPWKRLTIEDPNERRMLGVSVRGRLRRQGLTEIFFESAEPPFESDDPDEVTLTPDRFFKRFPAGEYEIEGITLEGDELESLAEITHVMPAPAVPTVNGKPMAEQCDPEEDGYDATQVTAPVTITWPAVTMSHPDPDGGGAGIQPPVPVTVHNYEVVVEFEDDNEFASIFSVVVSPAQTSITLPAEFTALGKIGDHFKYEVLAREESYNQTAVESCFQLL